MNDQLNEQLSAFVDNELPDEECSLFVRRLCKDDELQGAVNRFALIGDAMRGELLAADVQLSQRVQEAIAIESDESQTTSTGWPSWMRPLSGVAVAATVAAVAVLSLQGFDGSENTEFPFNTVADITSVDASQLLPVNVPQLKLPEVQPASVMPPSRMDQYLLRHREFAPILGGQSVLGIRDLGNGKYTLIPIPANSWAPADPNGATPE